MLGQLGALLIDSQEQTFLGNGILSGRSFQADPYRKMAKLGYIY